MDFITNPDMARAMRKFLRTGGLRFFGAVVLCCCHVVLYGRLSFAVLVCGLLALVTHNTGWLARWLAGWLARWLAGCGWLGLAGAGCGWLGLAVAVADIAT
jgi:hypothetical protein